MTLGKSAYKSAKKEIFYDKIHLLPQMHHLLEG